MKSYCILTFSFERTFPWDLAPNYDIIAVTSQPDIADQRLLFTRFVFPIAFYLVPIPKY
jgi:hypothetical protein